MERQQTVQTSQAPPQKSATPALQPVVPKAAPFPDFIQLQQSLGNHAVQRLYRNGALKTRVQAKLKVGAPNDRYEQEADHVAETVMRMPEPPMARPGEEDEKKLQRKPMFEQITPLVQRQAAEEEETAQRQSLFDAIAPAIQRVPVAVREDDDEKKVRTKPLAVQRFCPECEKEMEGEEGTVQRALDSSATHVVQRLCPECEKKLQRQSMNEEEEESAVQTKSENGQASAAPSRIEANIDAMKGGGAPLSESSRNFFEARFGADFSSVRLHTDSRAADTAKSINARAFTVGNDIAFGSGQYSPDSSSGKSLLAHELTHVIQQGPNGSGSITQTKTIQRDEDSFEEPIFEPTDTQLEEMEEEGEPVEQVGIVEPDEGTKLWPQVDRSQPELGLLPINTRVFVDRKIGGGWYSVYVEGHQRGESLPVGVGTHGYVAATRVNLDMPDPGAWFFRITKSGQGALAVAGEIYKDNFSAAWGKDYRYLVNVLAIVNESKGRKFLYKENPSATWDEAKTIKGGKIWVPGLELVEALHGQVSSGSISYEILSTLADIGIGVAGFIVGLLHGALMSIADIFIGAYDLIKMLVEIIIKLFKGTLISDAKAFFEDISKIKASDIIEMVSAKWNHPNTWDRWKFRGYVIGYAIVEILLMYFSVGIITAVKWVGKVGKLGKLAEYLSKLPKVQKLISSAKALTGKGIDKIRAALKAAHALSAAHGWAARVLRIPMEILRLLSEMDISKLKKLPQWVRERFARLADSVKLRLLGCASPCKIDIHKIETALKLATTGGKKLGSVDEILDVLKKLPGGLKLQTTKIAKKLRQKSSALMKAIEEAGLTDADFAKLADFLTPGDLENPAQAYRTFVRYVTSVVPAKTGKDVKKFNQIVEAMIKAEPRRGAALKGAMFEQWIALHVPELASRDFKRIIFDLKQLFKKKLPPYSRTVDKWVPDKGEIWEMKHQFSKVPIDQADDLAKLVGQVAPDSNMVKSVNYLFPTKAAAEMNKNLGTAYKFGVYYIDEVTNALTKLY